jgi:hypothetical protein
LSARTKDGAPQSAAGALVPTSTSGDFEKDHFRLSRHPRHDGRLTGGEEMRAQTSVFLAGVGFGLAIAWMVEALLVGRGVVSIYLGPLAILAVFASLLARGINLDKAFMRNFTLWIAVVLLLVALLTFWQPGFR